jgi:hypothetical protein
MLLALGSLTQDVTHILSAIELLGKDFLSDIKSWKISEDMNDFNLKGLMQARSFDLLGEIVSLKSLIPEDFEMDDAPVETDSTI